MVLRHRGVYVLDFDPDIERGARHTTATYVHGGKKMVSLHRLKVAFTYRIYQQAFGWLICRLLELRARWRGNVFHCAALAGESNYNVSINADLTVSCNCQDRDGTGRLGSLKTQSFMQIWHGEKADAFRRSMASGKLPIMWCSNCCDRKEVKKPNEGKPYTRI